ncbi:MAG: hypothetical protein HOV80_21470 [Polyangiaceae bacterium]|nr:hypothetical protein [Polyangiaceae bacterium]
MRWFALVTTVAQLAGCGATPLERAPTTFRPPHPATPASAASVPSSEVMREASPVDPADSCLISPDGAKLAFRRGGTLEVWDVGTGRPLLSVPVAEKRDKLRLANGGRAIVIGAEALDWAGSRASLETAPIQSARWSVAPASTPERPSVRLGTLSQADRQNLQKLAQPLGFTISKDGDSATLTAPVPSAATNKMPLGIHPSPDARVIIVTGNNPRGNPPGQGFAAGIDLDTGKKWRLEGWVTGLPGSHSVFVHGRSLPLPVDLEVIWGSASDRAVIRADVPAGQMTQHYAQLVDTRSGAVVRDLGEVGTDMPTWSSTGSMVASADPVGKSALLDASSGAPRAAAFDLTSVSFSADDSRIAVLEGASCSVYSIEPQRLLLSAPGGPGPTPSP